MIIYRVEKNGIGPYRYNTPFKDINENHSRSNNRPCIYSDIELRNLYKKKTNKDGFFFDIGNYIFGFTDPEQLKEWFWEYKEILRDNGYKINCYRVPKKYVVNSIYQAIFDKTKAKFVNSIKF